MKTSRRGFLSKIFAGAIAAPAVTKIIANGISEPLKQCDSIPCSGAMEWSGVSDWREWEGLRDGPCPINYDRKWVFSEGTFGTLRRKL